MQRLYLVFPSGSSSSKPVVLSLSSPKSTRHECTHKNHLSKHKERNPQTKKKRRRCPREKTHQTPAPHGQRLPVFPEGGFLLKLLRLTPAHLLCLFSGEGNRQSGRPRGYETEQPQNTHGFRLFVSLVYVLVFPKTKKEHSLRSSLHTYTAHKMSCIRQPHLSPLCSRLSKTPYRIVFNTTKVKFETKEFF